MHVNNDIKLSIQKLDMAIGTMNVILSITCLKKNLMKVF
jgi:hypothetical protein